ncbi:16S rRNA (cytidine(1402)-2'-O)-methyltransferase [Acutalibacter sp. 1XD8-33]|uniref:16S rRNA (cytidine(1402)-2'-O)-methyltransferase n=1 Tax=Acutalibacter sp. 1XD8-33 TaxID=2320081 RepID=UPI000EA249EA|nr:16S rRNA (cytidine(1402)-2'-O)-methyltransferase [Acutalibacter sp. 1XD8-33]RKJ41704.1 16S rRNA (cytidine(1402)-2'-O)-methyltransferase [Acutalibacter sp. 1XD8-33]
MLEKGALYVVGTPIGNLGDFSPRAKETLEQADFIAAEDTRVTRGLLTHFGLHKPLLSYFEHNKLSRGESILARLRAGETCALVSDAGMPAVSDPGETLIAACAQDGIPVYVVPGPTAAVSALAVSGLPTGRFTFEGFLSMNKRSRREHLRQVAWETRTMIFYEAPHKLRRTLGDLEKLFGPERKIAVVRELTKLHEEVWRTTLGEAAARYREQEPRGEYVLVVAGAEKPPEKESYTLEDAVELAKELLEEGASPTDAAKQAAKASGLRKAEIYKALAEAAP